MYVKAYCQWGQALVRGILRVLRFWSRAAADFSASLHAPQAPITIALYGGRVMGKAVWEERHLWNKRGAQ